ncbi:Auxin-responsive protein IAA31 [Zea mays]|uniref:Auxin-responsive protein n=1 Tax=Zea mays TaxID=4577 RepID=A0A317YC37_MAIZE|nr:Auxin-responsive protein IAA31 [Zea mays]
MEVAAAASYSYYGLEAADDDVDNLRATELRLGLPGTEEAAAAAAEAEEEEPRQAQKVAAPPSTPRGKKRDGVSGVTDPAPPAAKAQVVGWPPVRSYRKSCFLQQAAAAAGAKGKPAAAAPALAKGAPGPAGGGVFVKVSMDGAPYLRKVDLGTCGGYRQLREALEAMFLCFSGPGSGDASGGGGGGSPSDFAVTYEDKDGDLMLVGDVPFGMFIGTCKRLRIMKGSEARLGLGSAKNND